MRWFGERAFEPITNGFIGSTVMPVCQFGAAKSDMVWLFPEPGTMALLGLSLLGLSIVQQLRRPVSHLPGPSRLA